MFLKKHFLILFLLIGSTVAGDVDVDSDERDHDESDSAEAPAQTNAKREAAISSGYGPPEETEPAHEAPAPVYGPPSAPQSYSKSIPAAAIRNVETVAVTKTITPVVTKTTTYHSHAEPALSIGHVQGYQQTATGQPKIAPVQFQTQYTSYANPTVGVNGPVTYTGPAVVLSSGGGLVSMPISALSGTGSLSSVYGPPSSQSQSLSSGGSGGALPSTYGPPGQSAGTPLGAYTKSVPRYVSFRPMAAPHTLSLQNIQQLQQLRAPSPFRYQAAGSQISPMAIRATRLSPISGSSPSSSASSPYAIYQLRRPLSYSNNPRSSPLQGAATSYSPLSLALRSAQAYQPRPQLQAYQPQAQAYQAQAYQPQAQAYQAYQPQNFAYLQQPYLQQQQSHPQGPLGQPTVQYVQTYTMPSVSYTRLQPANKQQLLQQQQSTQSLSPQYQLRAIRQQVN